MNGEQFTADHLYQWLERNGCKWTPIDAPIRLHVSDGLVWSAIDRFVPGPDGFALADEMAGELVRERVVIPFDPLPMYPGAVVRQLLTKLIGLHGDEPCRLDHDGNCQTHFLEPVCTVAVARYFLEATEAPRG